MMAAPNVLMVTGAYYPEVSGGGLQCRTLVRALQGHMQVIVLTTTRDFSLPEKEEVDGVLVHRVAVDVSRLRSKLNAAVRMTILFVRLHRQFDVVHLHGFSQKSLLLILLAKVFGKKIVVKLTLVGEDDPAAIRARGRVAFWCYSRADLFVGVSPRLRQLFDASTLPREKFQLIPNGVDVTRFRPAEPGECQTLRRELGLPAARPLVLFVGLFSPRKRPQALFDVWARLRNNGLPPTGLVFVGATRARSYEIDSALAQQIKAKAQTLGLQEDVMFVEVTHEIEKYYRAADVFVLPSSGEGLPNALLEAMAAGLPCITTRLPGITDAVITHQVNGLLIPPEDPAALEEALQLLLHDPAGARELGQRARQTVEAQYAITRTAARCLEAYQGLVKPS